MTKPSAPTRSPGEIAPDELIVGFATSHIVRWFFFALLLHVVVIGGFSVGTIRDWLDPDGANDRNKAELAAAKAAAAPAETAAPLEAGSTALQTAAALHPEATQAPIEKATTEAAKPEDIPDAPDDLGLSIEDTNVN